MAARRRRVNTVTPYSRDYRRAPRWGMGLPPRKPQSRWRRFVDRVLDPVLYLKAVMLIAGTALIVLPLGADAVNASLKPARSGDQSCRILSVIDGDTVSLWCAGHGIERARLIGFDAPELFSPGCASELLAALNATWALRKLIFKSDRIEVGFEGQDRYGRALVRQRIDGTSVAHLMTKEGHVRAYEGGQREGWCNG